MRRIKEVTQITSKTTAVKANGYDGIITTVPLTDSADTGFLFTIKNVKVKRKSTILLTPEYSNSNGNSTQGVTLSGTSGTANVVVGGVNYLATFNTNLTTTASNFVTTHATALLARGIVVTSSGPVLTFVASTTNYPTITVVNVTTNLAGTVGSVSAVASTGFPIVTIDSYQENSFVVRIRNISTTAFNTFVKIHFKLTHN